MADALKESWEAWKQWSEKAEKEGKGTYVKEHVNWMLDPAVEFAFLHGGEVTAKRLPEGLRDEDAEMNVTAIPDAWLFYRVRPTFLIRHPALTFPSLMRTAIDNEGVEEVLKAESAMVMRWECSYTWHVQLYRYLLASGSYPKESKVEGITYPIILDAADLKDEALVRRYAEAVGLDAEKVRFAWQEGEKEDMGEMEARMKDTLLVSKGMVAGKLTGGGEMDIEAEKEKWRKEFGDVLTERLVMLVDAAMGEYEWLYTRRMRA
jgi:hypothetical protein